MASIFNLLENKDASPLSIVNSKVTLLEHITGKTLENKPKKDNRVDIAGYALTLDMVEQE